MSRGVARSRSKGAVPLARRGNAALGSPAQRKAAAKDEGPGRPMTLRSSRPWESESRRASLGNELEQMRGPRARIRQDETCPIRHPPTAEEVRRPVEQFVGIDVSKAVLDVAVRPAGDAWSVANSPEGIAQLVDRLRGDRMRIFLNPLAASRGEGTGCGSSSLSRPAGRDQARRDPPRGEMFWLARKKLSGSHRFLATTRRFNVSGG